MAENHIFYRVVNPGTWNEKYEFEGWTGSDEWIDVFNEIMPNPSEWRDASELGIYDMPSAFHHPKYQYSESVSDHLYEKFRNMTVAGAMVRHLLPEWAYGDMSKDPDRFFNSVNGDYDVVCSLVPYQYVINELWERFEYDSWTIYEIMAGLPDYAPLLDDRSFVTACFNAGIGFQELAHAYNYGVLTSLQSASSDMQSFILDAVGNGYISLDSALEQSDVWDIWMDSRDQGVPVEDIF